MNHAPPNVLSTPEFQTMTLQQITDAYPVSLTTLKRQVRSGALQAVRIGRKYHVTLPALQAWLNRPLEPVKRSS